MDRGVDLMPQIVDLMPQIAPAPIDVLIVGCGPAGMAAAIELRRLGVDRVVIAEREVEPGGIPRHSEHVGYGLRDLHRMTSGPRYAARYAQMATDAGVEIRLSTTVSDISPVANGATAVLLATGVRERPRAARLVPGDRPAGVYTTGALQQLVMAGIPVGRRAVVVGAEHVSYSALMTLRHGGCRPVALVTDQPDHQTYHAVSLLTAGLHRVRLERGRTVTNIIGRAHVEAVELDDGRRISCDTVVFTGDWIPVNELARGAGIVIDGGTRGPAVDAAMRTSLPGVFAAGNVLHGAETADVCALEGRRAAASIVRYLEADPEQPFRGATPIRVQPPLLWVCPNVVIGDGWDAAKGVTLSRARPRLLLRTAADLGRAQIEVRQGESLLWRGRPRGAPSPNRSFSIPGDWQDAVAPGSSEPATVAVASLGDRGCRDC
jgi:thioredoxin reductase